MEVRATEEGESECRSVTERIPDPVSKIDHITGCESRQTSFWSFTRESLIDEPAYEAKQITTVKTTVLRLAQNSPLISLNPRFNCLWSRRVQSIEHPVESQIHWHTAFQVRFPKLFQNLPVAAPPSGIYAVPVGIRLVILHTSPGKASPHKFARRKENHGMVQTFRKRDSPQLACLYHLHQEGAAQLMGNFVKDDFKCSKALISFIRT
jgi:hypothetical protein